MTDKINEIAESLINGNWGFNKARINRLNKGEFLLLIEHYAFLTGENLNEVVKSFKNYFLK